MKGQPVTKRTETRHFGCVIFTSATMLTLLCFNPAYAQGTTKIVDACSGVSLPPSVVTGIMDPVINGVTGPIEGTVNSILNLPLLGSIVDLDIDTTTLLDQAASGAPITLQVIASDGTLVGPSDNCQIEAQAFSLNSPAGLSIGGNRITGLGAEGVFAVATELSSVAIGDGALTDAGVLNGLALGTGARSSASNSIALGAGSLADRANTVSIGASGSERIITNVAAGTQVTDAANFGQLQALRVDFDAFAATGVTYTDASQRFVILGGAGGTRISNVEAGMLDANSGDAVNGSQLFASNQAIAGNTGNITTNTQNIAGNTINIATNTTHIATNTTAIANLETSVLNIVNNPGGTQNAIAYDNLAQTSATLGGAGGTTLSNVAAGNVADTSNDAINGAQLFVTNQNVAGNSASITTLDQRVTNNSTAIAGAQSSVTNLTSNVRNGAIGLLQYADPTSTTTPNGGTPSNVATLVGADTSAAVQLTNVANGVQANDAANFGQLQALEVELDVFAAGAVTYSDATQRMVSLGGTGGTTIGNVANGSLSAVSGEAVNGSQLFATNQAVADNASNININTQNIANLQTSLQNLNNGTANAVAYDGATQTSVTLAGVAGTSISNVAAGQLSAVSSDAVNGAQLFATNQTVDGHTTSISNNSVAINSNTQLITNLQTTLANLPVNPNGSVNNAVAYDDASLTRVTFAGAQGTVLTNVTDGQIQAGSSDAVTGSQLFAYNQLIASNTANIGTNATAITNANARIDTNTVAILATDVRVTSNASAIVVANNAIAANSVAITQTNDRVTVNRLAIADTNIQVAAHTTQIADTNSRVDGNSAAIASNITSIADTNTRVTANTSAIATNIVAIAETDARVASNTNSIATTNVLVATNTTAITQTDARVDGHDIAIAATQNAVNTLDGNVRNGAVGIVQYADAASPHTSNGGVPSNVATLIGASGNSPVRLTSVAAGMNANDAVNMAQMQAGMGNTLIAANAYTDSRLANLNFDLDRVDENLSAGIAGAVAIASMPTPISPGLSMVTMGMGHYRGGSSFAFGGAHASDDGRSVFRINASVDTQGNVTAGGGVGFGF